MSDLPVVVNSEVDGYLDAFMGRGNFAFVIIVTNRNTYKGFDNLNFCYRLETQDNESLGRNPDFTEYFDIISVPPTNFDLAPGEVKRMTFIIDPKKASMSDITGDNYSFNFYTWAEDEQGNTSYTGRNPYVNLAIFEQESDVNLHVSSKLLAKWQKEADKTAFIYSYRLTLTTSDYAVDNWGITLTLPEGAYAAPEWIQTISDWVNVHYIEESKTLYLSSNPGHVIKPGADINLDMQIVYPYEDEAYNELQDLSVQAHAVLMQDNSKRSR
ncbi:hypothetical protein [Kalamiella sp. sgz302252]|uniref:hypothetical protein n=1 Tax=Pantoea sp. sgz302252 TaxID=3341827 RepID=UPI0036D413C7